MWKRISYVFISKKIYELQSFECHFEISVIKQIDL